MTQPALRAAVFDLDGLIANTEDLYDEVGQELLRRRGKQFTKALKDAMMGRPGRQSLAVMIQWHGLDDTVETLQAESEAIFDGILPERVAAMPGLCKLLDRLDELGLPRAVATSSRRSFAEQVLSLLGLQHRFQFILSAEDVTHGKPAPEIYLLAARRFGIDPAEMLVLEDSQTGCQAAVAAGAFTVAVPGPHSRHHQFAGVQLVADTLADPRIVTAINHGNSQ